MIEIRQFDVAQDYEEICRWWDAHKWPCIPLDFLPDEGAGGRILLSDGLPIIAVWIYKTNSRLGWMEWMVSNPDAPREIRRDAPDLIIEDAIKYAKELGLGVLFTSIRVPRLIERLTKAGFQISDSNMTNLTKVL